MCAGKTRTLRATIVTLLIHVTRNVSVCVKCDGFFWKLTQIQTSHFRKVVWQHTEGMLVSIICILLQIYFSYQQWKNLENPLRIEKVIVMSLVYYFFGTQCSTQYCNTETVFCQYSPSSRPTSHLKGGQVKERWGQYSPSSRVGEDRAY